MDTGIRVVDSADDDDDELDINHPTPCQIGKRPPAPNTQKRINRPAIRESQVGGMACGQRGRCFLNAAEVAARSRSHPV